MENFTGSVPALVPEALSLTSPLSSNTPSTVVTPLSNRLPSPFKSLSSWYFIGNVLYPTDACRLARIAAVAAATHPDDHFVVFNMPDDTRVVVPRPLLQVAGGPLAALAGPRHLTISVESFSLCDDNALAFATLSRFLSCAPIDLAPRYAALVAVTATRWKIPLLVSACFAAVEPLPPPPPPLPPLSPASSSSHQYIHTAPDDDAPLSIWPMLLSHWMPLLDTHSPFNTISLPPRFRHNVARRIALTLPQIFDITRTCRRCSPGAFFKPYTKLRCLFCTSLHGVCGIWHVLYRRAMLPSILRVGLRVAGPSVATELMYVVLHRLRDEIDEPTALALLTAADWRSGWARVISNLSDATHSILNARAWRIIARLLASGVQLSVMRGPMVAAAFVNIMSAARSSCDTRRSISASGGVWGPWELHLAAAWHHSQSESASPSSSFGRVMSTPSSTQSAFAASMFVNDDDVLSRCTLRACVRLDRASCGLNQSATMKDASDVDDEGINMAVSVSVDLLASGCACEMGCMVTNRGEQSEGELLGDRRMTVGTTWGALRSRNGVQLTLLKESEFVAWVARHHGHCGLVVAVQVQMAGVDRIGALMCTEACMDEDNAHSQLDDEKVVGVAPAWDWATDETVCACSQCAQ